MESKEFISKWKHGIEMITPMQRSKVDLISYSIVLIGLCLGLIVNIRAKVWWLVIVLSGSLSLLVMTYLGAIQKYIILKKFTNEKEVEQSEETIISN